MDTNYLQFLNYGLIFILLCASLIGCNGERLLFKKNSFKISILLFVLFFGSLIDNNIQYTFSIAIVASVFYSMYYKWAVIKIVPYVIKLVGALFITTILLAVVNQYINSVLILCFTMASTILIGVLTVLYQRNKELALINEIEVVIESNDVLSASDLKSLNDTLTLIQNWFNDTECYLNSNYTIDQLEKDLKIDRKEISLAMNKIAGQNFYQFIAYYRVEHAKKMILADDRFTIETLSSECGFYSKSTFNKYFKKFEGQTPSRFKLSHT